MSTSASISNELHEILLAVHHLKKMDKGTYLFQEGGQANELYYIQSGKVQISKIVPDGRELTMRVCKEGELLGELALFSPSARHMLTAKVMESGEVGVILKEELEEKLVKNHALALEYMKWLNQQYRKNHTRFRDLVLHGKKGALYSTLIRLTNSYGIQKGASILIDLFLTNQDLANLCGTSREVINRLLSDLRKNDIISIEKGYITIFDLEHLKIEIDCEGCPVDICNLD